MHEELLMIMRAGKNQLDKVTARERKLRLNDIEDLEAEKNFLEYLACTYMDLKSDTIKYLYNLMHFNICISSNNLIFLPFPCDFDN